MAEMDGQDVSEPMSLGEGTKSSVRPADRHGLLKHSREFLDFFWDIAKPQQETRLEATEKLLEYLRTRPKVGVAMPGVGSVYVSAKMWRRAPGIGTGDTWSRTWMPR